jgi:hypothetical protein
LAKHPGAVYVDHTPKNDGEDMIEMHVTIAAAAMIVSALTTTMS